MLRFWRTWTERLVFTPIYVFHVVACLLIFFWWFNKSWLVAETKCMINLDFRNKTWKPCHLAIGLSQRCIYINGELIYCDSWDELGVTIHLISIPSQTDKFPGEEPVEFGEYSIVTILACAMCGLFSCFVKKIKIVPAFIGVILEIVLAFSVIKMWKLLEDAVVDHRPPVNFGTGRYVYLVSASLSLIATLIMIFYVLFLGIVDTKKKENENYNLVATTEAHELAVEMIVRNE